MNIPYMGYNGMEIQNRHRIVSKIVTNGKAVSFTTPCSFLLIDSHLSQKKKRSLLSHLERLKCSFLQNSNNNQYPMMDLFWRLMNSVYFHKNKQRSDVNNRPTKWWWGWFEKANTFSFVFYMYVFALFYCWYQCTQDSS